MFSYTQPREAILDYDRWYLKRQGEWQPTAVSEGKRHGKTVIAHLEGVDDRDDAAILVDCDIAVDREAMPDAPLPYDRAPRVATPAWPSIIWSTCCVASRAAVAFGEATAASAS